MEISEGRRYHVLEALGKGGFGTVYRAELQSSGGFAKAVALKVLNPDMEGVDGIVRRLRDEAKMLGMLRHRAIVQVDGLVRLNGRWTIVMEYVEGASLRHVLDARQRLEPKMALAICAEIAGALDMAYARPTRNGGPLGLLHRDIKPANVQLTAAGEVKLLDFGVARANFKAREAETKSVIYGSVPYMAPERFELEDHHQSDIYALAATLFELLVGEQLGQASPNPKRHEERIASGIQRMTAAGVGSDVIAFVATGLAFEWNDRPDARTFERRCQELSTQLPGPWLKDWAEQVVPPLLTHRTLDKDELSDSILVESEALSETVRNDGPPPGVPPKGVPPAAKVEARPPPRYDPPSSGGSIVMTIFKGIFVSISLIALIVSLGFVASFVGCMGACWGILEYGDVTSDTIAETMAAVAVVPESDPNRARIETIIERSYTDQPSGRLTIWEYIPFEDMVKEVVKDGKITDAEVTRVNDLYNQMMVD